MVADANDVDWYKISVAGGNFDIGSVMSGRGGRNGEFIYIEEELTGVIQNG